MWSQMTLREESNVEVTNVELHKLLGGMYADNLDKFDRWILRIYIPNKDGSQTATDYYIDKKGVLSTCL